MSHTTNLVANRAIRPVLRPALGLTAAAIALLGLAGCTVAPPSGPTVVAMPGPGVSFATFQQDDNYCRYYASQRSGNGGSAVAASQSSTNTAIGGTLLGTAAGALLGAAGGNAGAGAAIGAGTGLLLGSAAAGGNAQGAADSLQAQYNVAYAQCMVGHGNKMEGYAGGPGPSYGYGAPAYAPPGYYAAPGY
ncbi:hypothetical protein [Acidiphilium sp.]|uniref:hypothetical protein n=1 Tax=Acidiphilium sp. TaxID=527 RepID=UPI003D04DD2D